MRSNLIFKCFLSRDNETLVRAFRTYILPLLEYNSSIWSPHLIKDIRLIESVQRRFTKRLSNLSGKSYCERLNILHLERLDVRRLRADLILTYKILFGLTVQLLKLMITLRSVPILPPEDTDINCAKPNSTLIRENLRSTTELYLFGIDCQCRRTSARSRSLNKC